MDYVAVGVNTMGRRKVAVANIDRVGVKVLGPFPTEDDAREAANSVGLAGMPIHWVVVPLVAVTPERSS